MALAKDEHAKISNYADNSKIVKLNDKKMHHKSNYNIEAANILGRNNIDIEFQNIKYTVRSFSFSERKFITKEILHGINGAFRSGELTAIMGPSGAGKSTLLNIMSGYRATGVTGTIQVNGSTISTSSESYRRLSCYIHQDDLLRPMLTVHETMLIASHLKLGFKVSLDYKTNVIKRILVLLGLDNQYSNFVGKLSGGQKKRLAIALELISNPAVLFLDEPTTGLDSSSCTQCISLLKRLAEEGHTVVCTIHQPSALLFEMFDKLYMVSEGNCIYQGRIRELIPFLGDLDLHCPSYHNPADYILEVSIGEHNADMSKMINAANKKYYEDHDSHNLPSIQPVMMELNDSIELTERGGTMSSARTPLENYSGKCLSDLISGHGKGSDEKSLRNGRNQTILDMSSLAEAASMWMQFILLVKRNFVCSTRNYFLISARILSHVVIAIVFGYLYLNVGPKATTVLANYVYLYGSILLIVYTGKMAVVLSFPLEMEMMTREHFNRWYKLFPYFLSIISFEIPFQAFCTSLYIIISFYLTGNFSGEGFRFFYFFLMATLVTLSAQAWGFFVGATMPVKIAVFVGPVLAVLFSVFGFCTRYIDITPILAWMWHISYFRAAFHGVLNAVYGMNRAFLTCPETELYCHFRAPKVFLAQMMISDVSMQDSILLMAGVILIMHALTIFALWLKLTKR